MSNAIQDLKTLNFISAFQEIQADAAEINRNSWFTSPDAQAEELKNWLHLYVPEMYHKFQNVFSDFQNARAGLKLALATGELSETLEAIRKNIGPDDHIPSFTAEEAEVADAVLRLMNYSTDRKLRLAEAIVAKNEFNRTRADHRPESRTTEHGKRF